MEYYYSAVEGMMGWMNLRIIVLGESSQAQKDHRLTDSIYMTFDKRRPCAADIRSVAPETGLEKGSERQRGTRELGEGGRNVCIMITWLYTFV